MLFFFSLLRLVRGAPPYDTLFFAFQGVGSDTRLAAWDTAHCFTPLTPPAGCSGDRFVSVDYADGYIYAATASNVYVLPYPLPTSTAGSCGFPILPDDPLRQIRVARVDDASLYFSDNKLSGGLFTVPLPKSHPPKPPFFAPRLLCDARCDGVVGERTSLTVGLGSLFYGWNNASRGTGVSQLRLSDLAPSTVFLYNSSQRWVPTDLDGPAALPGPPWTSLWYSEWRYLSPGVGTVGLQWINFSASNTAKTAVRYLGGDPSRVPPAGSLAVDVQGAAAFFSSEADATVSLFNALQRYAPPLNQELFDFRSTGFGMLSDMSFVRGQGCRFPYASMSSGPMPLSCPQPLCGAPPAGTLSPTSVPSRASTFTTPPSPAAAATPHGSAAEDNAGAMLLLLLAVALGGGAMWWWRRCTEAARSQPQRRQQEAKSAVEEEEEEEEEERGGGTDPEKDTVGLVN
jgi:hypothetical protein